MILTQRILLKINGGKAEITDSPEEASAVVNCEAAQKKDIENALVEMLNNPAGISVRLDDILEAHGEQRELAAGYGRHSGEKHPAIALKGAYLSLMKAGGGKDSAFLAINFLQSEDTTFSDVADAMDLLKKDLSPDTRILFGQHFNEKSVNTTECLIVSARRP